MQLVSAYLLAVLGGNANPTESDITAILASVGSKPDAGKMKLLFESVKGKSIDDIIAEGLTKMSSVAASAGPATSSAGPAEAEPEKAPEAAPEPEESSEDDGSAMGAL